MTCSTRRRTCSKSIVTEGPVGRAGFERLATSFLNKLSPSSAEAASDAFATSPEAWGDAGGAEHEWRLHAFAALVVRHFAKVSRLRPARGSLFRELSILSCEVQAISPLLTRLDGLQDALNGWVLRLLNCQPLMGQRRLAVCVACAHPPGDATSVAAPFARLPNPLLRRVLQFLWPECAPEQAEVAKAFPPHATSVEMAIVFGHLQWSCSAKLWRSWGPLALLCVETLLPAADDADRLLVVAVVLLATCGRLAREPLEGTQELAAHLGRELAKMVAVRHFTKLPGFVRFRIDEAIAAAAALSKCTAMTAI